MSESKHAPEKWRAEDLRAQRKARLARMKSKDGGKKPIETKNPATMITVAVILAVALLLVGTWTAIRLGVPHRSLIAMTVGDEKIKVCEVNYYYHNMLSNYFNIDPTTDEGKATLASASGQEGFATVADLVKDYAAQQVQSTVMLTQNAEKMGLSLDDEDQASIDRYFDSLKEAAKQKGSEFGNFLTSMYGTGITEPLLRDIVGRQYLADKFTNAKKESFAPTDEEIQKQYEDNKDTYDFVDYRIFNINSTASSTASEADKTEGMNEAKAKAEEMMGKITDEASYRELCIEYATDAEKESFRTDDKSLRRNAKKSSIATDIAKWLFDASRKPGDKTVIKMTSSYQVVYMIVRKQADTPHTINVRHILVKADRDTADDSALKVAKTKAESILEQYLAGSKSEEAFGELAKADSEDNAEAGGLYEDITTGVMVKEFEDWCFDTSRVPGDTGIVQTDFGFHVMYFVKGSEAEWRYSIKSDLAATAYEAFTKEEIGKYPYKKIGLGMRFVA